MNTTLSTYDVFLLASDAAAKIVDFTPGISAVNHGNHPSVYVRLAPDGLALFTVSFDSQRFVPQLWASRTRVINANFAKAAQLMTLAQDIADVLNLRYGIPTGD